MVKSKIQSDVEAAEALEIHARERMYMAARKEQRSHWLHSRYLDWPTFLLAVVGAVFSIGVVGFMLLPGVVVGAKQLFAFSLKFWFQS